MSKKVLKDNRKSYRLNWFLSYITWPSALLFLGVGLLGVLMIEIQVLGLQTLRHHALQEANSGLKDFTSHLSDKINSETAKTSESFAQDTNRVIFNFESDLNNNLLGWAQTTTTTLNQTLNVFYDGMMSVVSETFGKTPLASSSTQLLNCLIGSKLIGIQKALSFVHDHAHVDLPRLSSTVLMLNTDQTQDLVDSVTGFGPPSQPSSLGTRVVDRLMDRYSNSLLKQRLTYLCLLGSYLLVILFSLIALLWDTLKPHPQAAHQIRDSLELTHESKSNNHSHPLQPQTQFLDHMGESFLPASSLIRVSDPQIITSSTLSFDPFEGLQHPFTLSLDHPPTHLESDLSLYPTSLLTDPQPLQLSSSSSQQQQPPPAFETCYPPFPPPHINTDFQTSNLPDHHHHHHHQELLSRFSPETPSSQSKWPISSNSNLQTTNQNQHQPDLVKNPFSSPFDGPFES